MVEAFDIERRQPQPGPLRPQEGRGDQRRPHAAAVDRRDDRPRGARSSRRPGVRRRPGRRRRAAHAARRWRCRWSHERMNKLTEAVDMLGFLFVDEATSTRPGRRRRSCSTTTGREVVAGGARRARRRSTTGRPRRSRRRCAPRSSRGSGSSRATPSGRCGSRSPGAGSRRRCSSRWSCSAATASLGAPAAARWR